MEDPMLLPQERQALASGRWFSSLSPSLRHDILRRGSVRRFRDRQAIFHCGEPASGWGAVLQGAVRVSATHSRGRALILCYMRPGLWFSDAAILDGGPRSYDAHAHGPTAMLMFDRADLLALLGQHQELYEALLRLHAGRTRQLFELVQDLQTLPLRARIAKQLARMARHHGVDAQRHPGEIRIAFRLGQEELAQLVSASRQRVNRELQDLRARGIIRTDTRGLVICDLRALQEVADGGEAEAVASPSPLLAARPQALSPWHARAWEQARGLGSAGLRGL